MKNPQFHILNTMQQALVEVFAKDKNADRMIDKYLRANPKWSADERSFFARSVYEITRHRRLLAHCAGDEDEFSLIGAFLTIEGIKLPARREFAGTGTDAVERRRKENKSLAVEFSFPDWLDQLGQSEFGTDWPQLMRALNQEPQIFLRANTLKSSTDKLLEYLKQEKIPAEAVAVDGQVIPDCLRLKERRSVFSTAAFKSGAFEMQDAGSQMIAPLLQVRPGDKVADTCAGAGGKTLHLAALMKNSGKIVAMDVHDWKLKDLVQRAQRAGATIIETKLITGPKIVKALEGSFDRVLIDAPCSGLGVLKRNPDSKWKLNPSEIETSIKVQKDILARYSALCKPGGVLVYATCSVLRRENQDQIEAFLAGESGKNWKLDKELVLLPHRQGFDGFYAARLVRVS